MPKGQVGSFERLTGAFGRLGRAGKTATVAGVAIVCVALLALAGALLGGESGGGSAASTTQGPAPGKLRGACTLVRQDGTLEQITLTGEPVSKRFCQAFASYLEETTGVEETTWSAQAPAKPLARANCPNCEIKPACRASIASARTPGEPVFFTVESEEAYDELHYDSTYAHDICQLLAGRIEIERFISHAQTG